MGSGGSQRGQRDGRGSEQGASRVQAELQSGMKHPGGDAGRGEGQQGAGRARAALTVAAQGALPHRLPAQVAPAVARGAEGEAVTVTALRLFPRRREDASHVGEQPRGSAAPPQPPRCPGPAGAPGGPAAHRLRGDGGAGQTGRAPAHGTRHGGRQRAGAQPHGQGRHGLRAPGGRGAAQAP